MATDVTLQIRPLSRFPGEKPRLLVVTLMGGCVWARTPLQDATNNPDLQTQKRGSRLSRITVFTSGQSAASQCYFTETGGVSVDSNISVSPGAYKNVHFAAVSLAACSLWHSSELLKALPCPLSRPLHVCCFLPGEVFSLQVVPPPPSENSLQLS